MRSSRRQTKVPLRFDDGFRAGIATAVSIPFLIHALLLTLLNPVPTWVPFRGGDHQLATTFTSLSIGLVLFFGIYLYWTHRVFVSAPPEQVAHVAAIQMRRGPSRITRLFGFKRAEDWALYAAIAALAVAGAAIALGDDSSGFLRPLLVVTNAVCAWSTIVYAFALHYFRLHSVGETMKFDISEEPQFIDFVSMAIMISALAAMPASVPTTRAGLSAVRTQTFVSFAFNTLIIAMVVSVTINLIG